MSCRAAQCWRNSEQVGLERIQRQSYRSNRSFFRGGLINEHTKSFRGDLTIDTARTTNKLRNCIVTRSVLGVYVAVSSYDELVRRSLAWAEQGQARAVFFAPVHMIMEAVDHPEFMARLNAADMVNPDGMPLVWALRALGASNAQRVCGPDAMPILLAAAEKAGMPVGFYGGSQAVLATLVAKVRLQNPKLNVAYIESPPFRALSPKEDAAVVDRIVSSGVRLLFVGLGCPKQENWVMKHRDRIPAVMFAVGAAFDFVAGTEHRAPRWMRRCSLEWAFRFASEPRRLAWRYLKHNPRFVLRIFRQLIARSA
jgi:N-acetylglucosaminyldiphosphoundecaprenol N-acetyl-beta-D-mannosaminyltransferase